MSGGGKKKVHVVVDSSSFEDKSKTQKGSGFDFSSFQQEVYGNDSQGQHDPTQQQLQYHEALPHQSHGQQEGEGEITATSYQLRKTSIVHGLTAQDLMSEHRKSIAAFSSTASHQSINPNELTGITLSRRHGLAKVEYEADLDESAYSKMETFTFGDGQEEGEPQQQEQEGGYQAFGAEEQR